MGYIIHSKSECIAFIKHLMEKENPVIYHHKYFAGLSRGMRDIAEDEIRILKMLKECANPEEAYIKMAKRDNWNVASKELKEKFSFILYREDLAKYLVSLGLSEENAITYMEIISIGLYKQQCKQHKPSWSLKEYGDIHIFATATHFLGSWDKLAKLFVSEYQIFSEGHATIGLLYEKAFDIVTETANGSTSHLQRTLDISYEDAEKLMSLLEKNGIVTSPDENGTRTVIIVKAN